MKKGVLKKGENAVIYSAITSLFLTAIKLIGGILSNSAVLISDSLDSISDMISMVASWIGFKIAQRKPSKRFPYGYYKAESIASLFASLLILYGSYELIVMGYKRIVAPVSVMSPLSVFSALASSIISFGLSFYLSKVGKETNSQLLMSTSRERMSDGFKSIVVLVAIVSSGFGIQYVEGVTTIAIAIMVLFFGLSSLKDSILALMDINPDPSFEEKIESIVSSHKDVKEISDIKLRKSGPFLFGEATIKVKRGIDIDYAHDLSTMIEMEVSKVLPQINSFLIHIEPFLPNNYVVAVPVDTKNDINSLISDHFGRAKYFAICSLSNNHLDSVKIYSNPFFGKKVRAGLAVAKFVLSKKVDVVITKEIGEISFNTLKSNLVEVYLTESNYVKEAINSLIEGELNKIESPTKNKD